MFSVRSPATARLAPVGTLALDDFGKLRIKTSYTVIYLCVRSCTILLALNRVLRMFRTLSPRGMA